MENYIGLPQFLTMCQYSNLPFLLLKNQKNNMKPKCTKMKVIYNVKVICNIRKDCQKQWKSNTGAQQPCQNIPKTTEVPWVLSSLKLIGIS